MKMRVFLVAVTFIGSLLVLLDNAAIAEIKSDKKSDAGTYAYENSEGQSNKAEKSGEIRSQDLNKGYGKTLTPSDKGDRLSDKEIPLPDRNPQQVCSTARYNIGNEIGKNGQITKCTVSPRGRVTCLPDPNDGNVLMVKCEKQGEGTVTVTFKSLAGTEYRAGFHVKCTGSCSKK